MLITHALPSQPQLELQLPQPPAAVRCTNLDDHGGDNHGATLPQSGPRSARHGHVDEDSVCVLRNVDPLFLVLVLVLVRPFVRPAASAHLQLRHLLRDWQVPAHVVKLSVVDTHTTAWWCAAPWRTAQGARAGKEAGRQRSCRLRCERCRAGYLAHQGVRARARGRRRDFAGQRVLRLDVARVLPDKRARAVHVVVLVRVLAAERPVPLSNLLARERICLLFA
jgi:hypothetical protein